MAAWACAWRRWWRRPSRARWSSSAFRNATRNPASRRSCWRSTAWWRKNVAAAARKVLGAQAVGRQSLPRTKCPTSRLPTPSWSRARRVTGSSDRSGVFQRIYGDPSPIFGKPRRELTGPSLRRSALDPSMAAHLEGPLRARVRRRDCCACANGAATPIWNISVFPIRVESEIRYAGGIGARDHAVEHGRAGTAPHRARRAQSAGIRAQRGVAIPARFGRTESHRARTATRPDADGPGDASRRRSARASAKSRRCSKT